jgi:hypothetical protein
MCPEPPAHSPGGCGLQRQKNASPREPTIDPPITTAVVLIAQGATVYPPARSRDTSPWSLGLSAPNRTAFDRERGGALGWVALREPERASFSHGWELAVADLAAEGLLVFSLDQGRGIRSRCGR